MNTSLQMLLWVLLSTHAIAATPIPPELVGEWRPPDGGGILYLRADGLAVLVGGPPPIGVPCVAAYDPKSCVLTLTPRLSKAEVPKGAKQPPDIKLYYDAKALTISSKDAKGAFQRRSTELSEPYKSFDLKKLPDQLQ
jgi:hypothetical protein